MATRPVLKPQRVIVDGDISSDIESDATILNQLSGLSYQVEWSGATPVGTLSIEFSNNYSLHPDGTVANPGTWTTATLQYNGLPVTTIPVSGNSGNALIDLTTTMAWASRIVYTRGSGTGTMSATVMAKVQ